MRIASASAITAFISTFIICAVLFYSAQSHADAPNYLPSPYAPWIEDQGYERAQTGTQNKRHKTRLPDLAPLRDAPSGPALTPRDTLDIIEALQESGALDEGESHALAPLSTIEQAYADRIIERPRQFGYDLFHSSKEASSKAEERKGIPGGAVQDDFVLSSGDTLMIIFRGQENRTERAVVNSQGLLLIEDMPPLNAAGRTIGQVRALLESMSETLYNTDIFVSLDEVRQIDILIAGHVKQPGRQTLTVFDSVIDALQMAGGIDKTGSLRQIKLVRGGRSTIIDLYGLLIHGSANMDLLLRDGDKIIVPPIGPTVAVAGNVKRPGIYEILPKLKGMYSRPHAATSQISLEEMLMMGGGVLAPGQNRFIKLDLSQDGRENVTDIDGAHDRIFGDGAILMVSPATGARSGTIELTGHTRRPGIYDIDRAPTLSALLESDTVLGADIYPLIGVIERWDESQMASKLLDFSPILVRKGEYDQALKDGDVVYLFSHAQISALPKPGEAISDDLNNIEPASGSALGLDQDEDLIIDPAIRAFLTERSVSVRGAVRKAGFYPISQGASLENIMAMAGGPALEANTNNIEVTSALHGEGHQAEGRSGTIRRQVNLREDDPDAVMLAPGDTVRVNQRFKKVADKSVLIIGEVAHPGRYDLMPGDKMSDLLARAGGLSPHAYPEGTIFSRESERRAEEARFRAAARDMERAIAAASDDKDNTPDREQLALARALAAELKEVEAVGRITVEADPGILQTNPALDFLLAGGDRVYIPKRPMTVRVAGEVLSPASLQFREEKDPRDYIAEAGGFTYHADKDRAFVLFPDGSAKPLQVGAWNHSYTYIPPGSTIIVPRDPKPFDFIQSARDVTQILSNLAITGIFLDDLSGD